MSLFGRVIRTAVNVATAPVAVVKDVFTLGNVAGNGGSFTGQKIKQIKEEAED